MSTKNVMRMCFHSIRVFGLVCEQEENEYNIETPLKQSHS